MVLVILGQFMVFLLIGGRAAFFMLNKSHKYKVWPTFWNVKLRSSQQLIWACLLATNIKELEIWDGIVEKIKKLS